MNVPEARLCQACGTRLRAQAPAPPEAVAERLQRLIPQEYAERLRAARGQLGHERRLVTILFCDVKGSTAMAESLDPEEVLEVMDGAFEVLIPPVYRHEGTLARLMGDAILAFFGAPLAHEDDPERAIRAGLEILAGAQVYARKLEQEQGIRGFNVRVGIHTGQVVVGEVGSDLRAEYTAMGDAVNLAARMEQHAPPGGILITQATYRHVRGVFDVRVQPPLQVKGKAEPVQAYRVEGAKPRAWRMGRRGVEGLETRMVGREAELLMLREAYREVAEDRAARAVTVVGEPGVGKSRLLDEFAAWVELEGEQVAYLRGRATAEGRAVAYSLWRELFAYQFDILDTDGAALALAKFREGLAGLLPPERADLVGHVVGFDFSTSPAVAGMLGSPSFGQAASSYLVQGLRVLAGRGPVVMLLEDLHWADDSSLDLLAQIVDRLAEAPLLVVGAARPELWERRPNWGEGQQAYSRLELKPLSRRASRALVQEILQKVHELPEAVQQLVVEGAEGNPFYAEELVKMLIEDGAILPDEEEWRVDLDRLAQVRVPPTLTAVLQARLDALSREEKGVLQRASVVGREFWGSLVGELASGEVRAEDVGPLLAALRGRELVYRRERSALAGAEEYLFKHAVLRDVTYETVLLKLRRRYHGQVAAWLEEHAGERLGEYLTLIAGHYELAGNREKAAGFLRRSGEELFRVGAYRAARQAFERALALLPAPAPGEPRDFSAGAGEEGPVQGTEARAALHYGLGLAHLFLDQYPEAQEQLETALELAQQVGDRRLEAQALARFGQMHAWLDAPADAERLSRASMALAHECGDKATEAMGLRFLAMLGTQHRERLAEATALAEAARALSEQIGDRQGMAAAIYTLANIAMCQLDWDEARRRLTEAQALTEADGHLSAQISVDLAICAFAQERWEETRTHAERAQATGEEIGSRSSVVGGLRCLFWAALRQGRAAEARSHLEHGLHMVQQIGARSALASHQAYLGYLLALEGKPDAGWAQLVGALREYAAMDPSGPKVVDALVFIANVAVRAGRWQRGAELLGLCYQNTRELWQHRLESEAELKMLRAELGAEGLEAALARGEALDLEQAVAEILACGTPEAYWGGGLPGS
jgi:class 3 adenylate cyclase/tetratricopeptide (TPR) repeat protein